MCLIGVAASLVFLAHEVPTTLELVSVTNVMMSHLVSIDTLDFRCARVALLRPGFLLKVKQLHNSCPLSML